MTVIKTKKVRSNNALAAQIRINRKMLNQAQDEINREYEAMTPEERNLHQQETEANLLADGWETGSVGDLLGLTAEDEAAIEYRLYCEKQLTDIRKKLACILREHRIRAGLSQAQLANRIGTSQSRIAFAEGGYANNSLDLIVRALIATGATASEIGSALQG